MVLQIFINVLIVSICLISLAINTLLDELNSSELTFETEFSNRLISAQ